MKWPVSASARFYDAIDSAGELTFDAARELRAANVRNLPPTHHALLADAIDALQDAQTSLFYLRNEPWQQPLPAMRRRPQLELA